ncbi:hypothetical protein C8Q80DRAFT_1267446 [Daedaleopsis nitida]|nr:hypothetical protein C8Q80DRAFT_1267446 [Daedaleopsis nitida]
MSSSELPRIVYLTDTVDAVLPLQPDRSGCLSQQTTLVRLVVAEIAMDTFGLIVRSHDRAASPGTAVIASTVIDEHFWYGVQEGDHEVTVAIYDCRERPDSSPARWTFQFHEVIDLDEFVHYIAHAKARVSVRRLYLQRKLAEVNAIQITYLRVLGTPRSPSRTDSVPRGHSAHAQGTPLHPEDDDDPSDVDAYQSAPHTPASEGTTPVVGGVGLEQGE